VTANSGTLQSCNILTYPSRFSLHVCYFEITWLVDSSDRYVPCPSNILLTVAIVGGFCHFDLLGWEVGSWGYCEFIWQRNTVKTQVFKSGHTIGCCLNLQKGHAFYTKNGANLGVAFTNPSFDLEVYPAVTLGRYSGELPVQLSFGQTPFKFDIAGYVEVMI
jgi:hypothetical protein